MRGVGHRLSGMVVGGSALGVPGASVLHHCCFERRPSAMSIAVAIAGLRAGAMAADSRGFDLDKAEPTSVENLRRLEDRIVAFAGVSHFDGKDFGAVLFEAVAASRTPRQVRDSFLDGVQPEFGRAYASLQARIDQELPEELFFQAMILWRDADGLSLYLLWPIAAMSEVTIDLRWNLRLSGRGRAACEAVGQDHAIIAWTERARLAPEGAADRLPSIDAVLGPEDYRRLACDLVQRCIDASPTFGDSLLADLVEPDVAESLRPVSLLGGPVVSATIEIEEPIEDDGGSDIT